MEKTKEEERRWWEKHINEESELKKPYRNAWEYSRWQKSFSLITNHYDFNGKRVFVGCCGTGIFEEAISKLDPSIKEIVGLDLSPTFVKLAKMRNIHNLKANFILGDLEETHLESNYFDVSVIIDGLHHVPHPYTTLKELKRISRDVIFDEPNALNPIRRINELKYRNQGVRESSFYECQLFSWLKDLDYRNIVTINIGFIPTFVPEKLMKYCYRIENMLEHTPVVKKISGGFLIIARS